jgi:EAL domain-containing protein (putative c-di-GMP-specific phosphodiesterase class I)/CheY-like chemotaxis protein
MKLQESTTANRHVVLVDDDPFMLSLLGSMLSSLGFDRVTAASNGSDALALANAPGGTVDVIILDINMPDMDGIELVRQLAAIGYAGALILVSGESSRMLDSVERLVRSHQLSLLGALRKPPSLRAVRELLQRYRGPKAGAPEAGQHDPDATIDELHCAIDAGQIVPYYQPQISLLTGQAVGVECLARWHHPSGRIVGPGQFIPLAEEHRQVGAITNLIVGAAVRQCRAWNQRGLDPRVAINVSMQDLGTLDLPDDLSELVDSVGVNPDSITLEVTESCVMQNMSTVLDILTRLRLRRFHLSIDDFGTGHSSLAQLRDLPFDELKIDRSFVHGAGSNTAQHAICQAAVHIARKLGMHVVAEGIEDAPDRDIAAALGCTLGQGYLIAKPMPAGEMTRWLIAHGAQASAGEATPRY